MNVNWLVNYHLHRKAGKIHLGEQSSLLRETGSDDEH